MVVRKVLSADECVMVRTVVSVSTMVVITVEKLGVMVVLMTAVDTGTRYAPLGKLTEEVVVMLLVVVEELAARARRKRAGVGAPWTTGGFGPTKTASLSESGMAF